MDRGGESECPVCSGSPELNKDLVLLVADGTIEATVDGLLGRQESLQVRPITFDIEVHPQHDPGCLRRASYFLRPWASDYHYAIVMFDREGCGQAELSACELEQKVKTELANAGWRERAAVIVLDPELEAWVWSDSPEVDRVLGWKDKTPSLRQWLRSEGLLAPGQVKPSEPKKALECALREVRKPRSSVYYRRLAESVGLGRCRDESFGRFRQVLQRWFSSNEA